MNSKEIRKQFPIFEQKKDAPFVYLDNAATTQKPQVMIDAIVDFYTKQNANIHRGVYTFGEQATQLYEKARATVASFMDADADEIIFVKNATEGINLIAQSWAMKHLKKGDNIVLSEYEHHANLLPWQRVAQLVGATITFVPVKSDGTLAYEELDNLITSKTKLVACSAISNVTGAHTDMKRMIQAANKVGAKVLIDAAQAMAHESINVKALDVDFLVFSGHKVFGPTGIGVLYIKKDLQKEMDPYQVGGGTVFEVDWQETTYLQGPHKFEAGTPPIAQAIGLAASLKWLENQDMRKIQQHEATLVCQLIEGLQTMSAVQIVGPIEQLKKEGHLVTFVFDGIHAHDVASYLGEHGVAVRAGHHCAQPLAKKLHIDASIRVSVACYNTLDEIDFLLDALSALKKL